MAEDKQEGFDHYRYEQDYIKENLIRVLITFNRKKPDDVACYEWLKDNGEKMSTYIKRLITEDMIRRK